MSSLLTSITLKYLKQPYVRSWRSMYVNCMCFLPKLKCMLLHINTHCERVMSSFSLLWPTFLTLLLILTADIITDCLAGFLSALFASNCCRYWVASLVNCAHTWFYTAAFWRLAPQAVSVVCITLNESITLFSICHQNNPESLPNFSLCRNASALTSQVFPADRGKTKYKS